MKKQPSNRSGLLLMEIIIAILLFSVVSAICLQLFVKSHNITQDAIHMDNAVFQVSSMAELLQHNGGDLAALSAQYPDGTTTKDGFLLHYDKSFNISGEDDAPYTLEIKLSNKEHQLFMFHITVFASKDGTTIYELDTLIHQSMLQ